MAALHGHAPADAADWPYRDLELLALAHEVTLARQAGVQLS